MSLLRRTVGNLVFKCSRGTPLTSLSVCLCMDTGMEGGFAGVWVVAVRNKPKENTFALKKKNEHRFLTISSGFKWMELCIHIKNNPWHLISLI